MKALKLLPIFALTALFVAGCTASDIDNPGETGKPGEEKPSPVPSEGGDGLSYVWDKTALPEIIISVSLSEWNSLLSKYDSNNKTKEYVRCNVTFVKGDDRYVLEDAGLRLRGNTSRRRPEKGSGGHKVNGAQWQHCHFGLNFRKFVKDDAHQIKGIRKMNLKWANGDPSYARENFCYDLFGRAGVWTAAKASYARVWVHVEGDSSPAYYGVYTMIEPYDNKYISRRKAQFVNTKGNLWKCCYTSNGPADMRNENANMGEDDNVHEYTYELKETEVGFSEAKAQLQDFIRKINNLSDSDFKKWMEEKFDVPLFLRTVAVDVAVGMWDDMWNNGNNYYLYFDSPDRQNYKVFVLPYDYDNTLGTSNTYDPAKQNPTEWGTMCKLMRRVMGIPEFKQAYVAELKRLVDPVNGLMDYGSATARIRGMQKNIEPYVSNDTGSDMSIKDEPASWSNCRYRLLSSDNNYFKVKAATISGL